MTVLQERLAEFERTGGIRFSGKVSRVHNPKWAWGPLSGDGAAKFGGRFNPQGVDAFYSSLDVFTALFEAQSVKLTPHVVKPVLCVSYDVDVDRILDLSDSLQIYRLFDQDWDTLAAYHLRGKGPAPEGWKLYTSVDALQIRGLLVDSYANDGGKNLVLFDWDDKCVQINDPDQVLMDVYGDRLHFKGSE